MILLTGSKGFIGQNFSSILNESIIELDFDNCFNIFEEKNFFSNVDLIIHQGAISSTVETDVLKLTKYNVEFTIKLFEKAIEYQIPVKYASSASVYGNSKNSFCPLNNYAVSKLQIDYYVMNNINRFKYIQGFRYFNVYGPGEELKGNQASPIHKFTFQAKNFGEINLFEGSENFFRDFIYVKDVIEIVLNNKEESGIFDLGTSNPTSFSEIANLISRKYKVPIKYIEFPNELKNKYQYFTCAKKIWGNYSFKTIKEVVM